MEKEERKERIVVENNPYYSPTPGELPLMCIAPFQSSNYMEKGVSATKDCGLNLIQKALETEDMVSLSNKIPAGMYCLARKFNPKSNEYTDESFQKFKNYVQYVMANGNLSKISGWMLTDEPITDFLGYWKKCYDYLYDYLSRTEKLQSIYINLNTAAEKAENYMEYLNLIQIMFQPAIWSYDLYPFWLSTDNKITFDYNFYLFLKYFIEISNQTNRPFYAYVLCCQYGKPISLNDLYGAFQYKVALPTLAQMRIEAFSALACGAQGLCFWRFSPEQTDEKYVEDNLKHDNNAKYGTFYYNTPLTYEGNKTPLFEVVKELISEIKDSQHIFLNCNVSSYGILSSRNVDFPKITQTMGPFINLKASSSQGFILSLIKKGGSNYLVIVNQDPVYAQNLNINVSSTATRARFVFGNNLGKSIGTNSLVGATFGFEPGECQIISY